MVFKAIHHWLQLPTLTPQSLSLQESPSLQMAPLLADGSPPRPQEAPSLRGPPPTPGWPFLALFPAWEIPLSIQGTSQMPRPLQSFLESLDRINATIHFFWQLLMEHPCWFLEIQRWTRQVVVYLVRTEMLSDKLPYIVDIPTRKLHHKLKEHKNRWLDRT